jgi:hypothetical protein
MMPAKASSRFSHFISIVLVISTLTPLAMSSGFGSYASKSVSCVNGVCISDSSSGGDLSPEDLRQHPVGYQDSFTPKSNRAFLLPNKNKNPRPRIGAFFDNLLARDSIFGMLGQPLADLSQPGPSVESPSNPAFTHVAQTPAKDTGGGEKSTSKSGAKHTPSESQKKMLTFYNEVFLAAILLMALSGTLVVGRHHIRSLWHTCLRSNESSIGVQSLRAKAH